MKKFLLSMLGVLLALPGFARDFAYKYEGQTLTYTVIDEDAKTCQTKADNSVSGVLVIPAVAKDGDIEYSVTTIGDYTFYECSAMTSVAIPNSVTSIGDGAFIRCSAMTSVTIGNSVTSIGSSAFSGCSGLTSVTIPNSVTTIGDYTFYECSGLTSVTIGNSVISIGKQAFSGCSGLTSVAIPNSVTTIGESAFSGCYGLTSVTIGNSVTTIGERAFGSCSHLTSVTIGNSVTSIGDEAFYGCSGLTSVIIPNSVTSIGERAFGYDMIKFAYPSGLDVSPINLSYVTAIEYPREDAIIEDGFVYGSEKSIIYFATLSLEGEFAIPNSVTSIGSSAFSYCSGLTSVTIPNSVTTIGERAFYGCSGLTSVTIPNSITSIGNSAFSYCSGLTSVTIPNSVTSIGERAFSGCSGLTSVTIPNSVTSIGERAFSYCSGLTSVTIPNSVTSIGNSTFYECSGLTSVTIPNSVTSIGSYAFYGCSAMTSVTIGNSVTSIGEGAFEKCSGLTSVKTTNVNPPIINNDSFDGVYAQAVLSVPEDAATNYLVTNWSLFESLRIGDSEIAYNTYETGNLKYRLIPAAPTSESKNLAVVIPGDYSSLTEVTIPERITVSDNGTNERYYVDGIGYKAFNDCSNLATVTFNSRNTSKAIGEYAFANTNISAITIPETVHFIGDHAFDNCQSLAETVIPGNVKTIGNYAFSNCRSLAEIVIPGNVKTIGNYAFSNCGKLKKVEINAGVSTIGNNAFNCCSALTEITVPGSVETIGFKAFNACEKLTTANLEAGVKTIGAYAFFNASALKEITLNEGLETIGEYAFYANEGLTVSPLYIPSTLKTIGEDAFQKLKCEYINISDLVSWCNINFANANSNPASTRRVNLHLNNEIINNLVIPESISKIKDYAFYNVALSSVTIPGNVTSIGASAFASRDIRDITFAYGSQPVEIAADAFYVPTSLSWDRPIESLNLNVNSLENLTIGNSVTEIPASKFKGITRLTSLTLGNGLMAIGDEAFSGCTGLTEVILPPSVETIGASAFADNSKLTSIIMGHKVKSIGEKAYNLCPIQTVSITAQTPPTAPDNTFSNYTGTLYVQGQKAVETYYNADYCWFQFEGHVMIEPTDLKVEGDKVLTGKPGDTFQLTAKLYPDDVTLPQIFWRSTNPDIATVDKNGLVTLHADMSDIMAMAADDNSSANSCKIIAESLYADGPVAEVTVNNTSGIDEIVTDEEVSGEIDFTAPVEVYNLQGMMVARTIDNLASGIYIVRQGKNVKKIAVK